MRMPALETERLLVREFGVDDLSAVHQLLDVDLAETDWREPIRALGARRRWLEWTVLSYEQLPDLRQPPYGDRAIVLKRTAELVGACGLVPCLGPFDLIPSLRAASAAEHAVREGSLPEVGLYWAVSPAHQRQGYATEAAQALVAYAFSALNIQRVVALTNYSNIASIGVMRKLGMQLDRNPAPEPPWLQVVGVLERPPAPSG
jgi:[ribosomal protein S5]-alanine N-acetyltransferase